MREKEFETYFIKDLEKLFPGSIVIKNYPNYLQGFPDRLILFENTWAAFEFKRGIYSPVKQNQAYYIDLLNSMSYASFVNPQNAERVKDDIQQAFRISRSTRLPIRKQT